MRCTNVRGWIAVIAAVAYLSTPSTTWGLINVNFTPVDLVRTSASIAAYSVAPDADAGTFTLKQTRALKGKQEGIGTIDVSAVKEDDDIAISLAEESFTVLVFQGDMRQAKANARTRAIAALHVGSTWYGVEKDARGRFRLAPDALDLKAVWDGGGEQLARAVRYILTSRAPRIPTTAGVQWQRVAVHGKIAGKVGRPVSARRDGTVELLYPSTEGDVLVTLQAGRVAVSKLPGKSKLVSRVDLNRDGKGEWIGYDGRGVYSISAKALTPILADLPGVRALRPITVGGRPALLAVSSTGPVFLESTDNGKYTTRRPIDARLRDIRDGRAFDCNSDGLCDLVLVAGEAVFVSRATRQGGYAPAKEAASLFDLKLRTVLPADFDGDGHIDLLLAGADSSGVYVLAGNGKSGFRGVLHETGELSYHGAHALTAASLGDVNNDGLIDVVLAPRRQPPALFFNRGFGTFGLGRQLHFPTLKLEGVHALVGNQSARPTTHSAALVDINADGALDLLCVTEGQLVSVTRKAANKTLGVRIRLADGLAGPVTVKAIAGGRQMGSVVLDSAGEYYFGKSSKGPLDLAWTMPDGTAGRKRVIVLKATEYTIGRRGGRR